MRRVERAAERVHAEFEAMRALGFEPEISRSWSWDAFTGQRVYRVAWRHRASLKDNRWQLALCDCGRWCGSGRCDFCWSVPAHPVEMQLTPSSAQLYALRGLPAYKALGLGR